jgi:hypothetical protein
MIGLAPGVTHVGRVGVVPTHLTAVPGDGLTQIGQACRWAVMGETIADGLHAGFDDMPGCIEVRLANLQVDYIPTLGLQCSRLGQHLKCRLGAQVVHSGSYFHPSSGSSYF